MKNLLPKEMMKGFGDVFLTIGQHFTRLSEGDTNGNRQDALKRVGLKPIHLETLGFKEAIAFFSEQAPVVSYPTKAALLLETQPPGYLVTQVFLDDKDELVCQDNDIPYGRRVLVQTIDAELVDAMRGKNLLILT